MPKGRFLTFLPAELRVVYQSSLAPHNDAKQAPLPVVALYLQ